MKKYSIYLWVRYIIIIIYLFLSYYSVKASNDTLFKRVSVNEVKSERRDYLNIIINSPITKSYSLVKLNRLIFNQSIIINLDDNNKFNAVLYENQGSIRMKTEFQNIFGSFLFKNKKLRGYVQFKNEKFEIIPIDSLVHIIILIDETKIPSELCNFNNDSLAKETKKNKNPTISTIPDECNIRILVAYTPNARDARGGEEDINDDIQWAVQLTIESYDKSNVNQRIELARTILTNYTETGNWDTDVGRFFNPNDGIMDELDNIRDLYSADCMVLIIDDDTYCGQAESILSNESTARCVVSAGSTCLTTYFSFAHELGHLMGCDHDPSNEVGPAFPYGHGFCHSAGDNWRTIMSYQNNCALNRIQFWSNPDIEFQGDPMGDVWYANNHRVLNETEETIREFRLTPLINVIPLEIVTEFNIADFLARSILQITWNFIAEENSEVSLRAGDEVILSPGTRAEIGSNVHVFIDDCGTQAIVSKDDKKGSSKLIESSFINYKFVVVPNPANNSIEVKFKLEEGSPVQIQIINSLGQTLLCQSDFYNNTATEKKLSFDVSTLPSGLYFVVLRSQSFVQSKQIVILK
ncbi:MAG: hypothetical protein A2X61_11390 [Ignavibacteria bacterium GWB2_35_12]|nr:MAG: hypothetical protein A2X63_01625 [Ignavibacteria bacterium GWA2_35_8]OGU39635.1 MAG: hypothetical protein A2X61_11390 [Ignavibacteria bacterium GWB2_35_12]OGV24037.1 MAG: hypothetical protein A2475_11035 [Ignavibacteria bacterium RIFOXYC2_FULL_35_21]